MLTLAYLTSRKEPHFEWFAFSLSRELKANPDVKLSGLRIVIVDYYAHERSFEFDDLPIGFFGSFLHVAPKPTPWQGQFRQTQHDYFAASNARNTAICFSPDGYVCFVDDLSVLMPGWLAAVVEAQSKGYIACGAYRKVFDLKVGENITYQDNPHGHDSRWRSGHDRAAIPCSGNWAFGCSLAAPVEAFLEINGYPEACDGMGYEDCVTGVAIERRGFQFRYDRRMLTLESEEGHHVGTPMLRRDPGVSPNDKSHAMLARYMGVRSFDNPFDIRQVRQAVLAGEEFPLPAPNQAEWFTGTKLSELTP
jgi:hypothetical protein